MIRINLLPVKQVKKVQAGQRQLLIFGLAVVVELALMFLFYQMQASEVQIQRQNATLLESEIDKLKQAVGDFDRLKKTHGQLKAQEKVISDLQKGRTGPVLMLRELSEILSPGKGPTIDRDLYEKLLRDSPYAGYNTRWNPHRLWLEELVEKRGLVRIKGMAKDYDDVAEFNKRLNLSRYFSNDFLERNDLVVDPKYKQKVVRFSVRAKAAY